MAKMTLVVLAAGMGTRFGTRIKQLEKLGPDGELLIDYSVYDAIRAGFDRVVFIIRRDIEELFKSTIGARVEKRIQTDYVFQSTDQLPVRTGDFPGRTRPWGTAQALWCCREVLDGPFAIVNADDFYGQDAFRRLGGFLSNFTADACSVGFMLRNTLSDFGTVNRGVCKTDAQGLLTRLERQLSAFLEGLPADEPAAELTIADAVDAEIGSRGFRVQNLTTDSRWFGITYEADVDSARETLKSSINSGVYPAPLWG